MSKVFGQEKYKCPDCGVYYWVDDGDNFICPNCQDKSSNK